MSRCVWVGERRTVEEGGNTQGRARHSRAARGWAAVLSGRPCQNVSSERLVPQTRALDARTLAGDFAVPVFVIQGAEDFTTPTSLARSFIDSIRAPAKTFVAIEGGGHFAVFMKSSAFLNQPVGTEQISRHYGVYRELPAI
jgi:pimeloyl-ACP methyl ester carboxylesterase